MKTGNPLTGRPAKPKKYAALRQEQHRRAEEAPMSPETEQIHIPEGYRLEQRPVCHQRSDERPMLRDEHGNVRAVVETWRPDLAVN